MSKRFCVGATFRDSELRGALVQLCGHLDGFIRRTTESDEQLRELLEFGHSNEFNHGWTQMDTDKTNKKRPTVRLVRRFVLNPCLSVSIRS